MAVKLLKSNTPEATPPELIKDWIKVGAGVRAAYEGSRFYRKLNVRRAIGNTIRHCNMALGVGERYKNGCLYREVGLAEFWKKGLGEQVVCDHAIPIAALVDRHLNGEPIEQLMFSPIARITKDSNQQLTKAGYGKSGHKDGFPLFRYSRVGIEIITHRGDRVDPATWTDADHWKLVRDTEELREVVSEFAAFLPPN